MLKIAIPTNNPGTVANYLDALSRLDAHGEAGRSFNPSGCAGLLRPGGVDVNPALYGDSVQGGYVKKTAVPMTVIADANIPAGSGILTLAGRSLKIVALAQVKEVKVHRVIHVAQCVEVTEAKLNGNLAMEGVVNIEIHNSNYVICCLT